MTSCIQTNHLYFAYDEKDTLQAVSYTHLSYHDEIWEQKYIKKTYVPSKTSSEE